MKLKENIKVTPSFPLSPREKLSIIKALKDKSTHKFVADPLIIDNFNLRFVRRFFGKDSTR